MVRKAILVAALLASATMAQASDKPLYAPVPDWVKPAPAVDPAKLGDNAPVFLILDRQQRLKDGQVWSYHDTETRAASPQVLSQIGTITLNWAPDKGDLIVHRAEIIRGDEHIDLLKGSDPFTVLHREQQLEQLQLDGMLTATMPVSGLRVGDVLRLTYSTTEKDATLAGNVQNFEPVLADPFRVQFARERMIWPDGSDLHYKVLGDKIAPTLADMNGYHELVVTEPVAKQPDLPDDAPARYKRGTAIEASSFADWASVSKIMAPLYDTTGTIQPGSPLAAEVDKIEKATPDPAKRAMLALQLVQDKVRYLFKGMDNGNYVPQKPADTWAVRYGDCKAKTMLLLALLHEMKIDAEPVLASSKLGDAVPTRLPMPGAFDHVFVHATIGAKSLWFDGTSSGAQLADIDDVPPFHNVLPLRAGGAGILPLPVRPSARPDILVDVTYDKRAGLFFPGPFTLKFTMRGPMAQAMKAGAAQASRDDIDRAATKMANDTIAATITVTGSKLTFDDAAGTATIIATGIAEPEWTHDDQRYRVPVDKTVAGLSFAPDRARAAWQNIPVSTGEPAHVSFTARYLLPNGGKGFTLDGAQTLDTLLAGETIHRTTTLGDGVLVVHDEGADLGTEIDPKDLAAERQRVAAAQTHLLRLQAPTDYPQDWATLAMVRKNHGFDPALDAYQQRIDAHPDEAISYLYRAHFASMIYDRAGQIADLTKALALAPDASTYVWRAHVYRDLGQKDKAIADYKAAQALDPGSTDAISGLASIEADRGDKDAALALVQSRIDEGGKDKTDFLALKADILSRTGNKDGALSTIDSAIAASPGNPSFLNSRCWIKGTQNVALDTALKDCTKSMELSDSPVSALDSRAMVYFRMDRMDDALADLNAALDLNPDLAGSLYMRGVIQGQQGASAKAAADLAAARLIEPQIDQDYARFGIKP